MEVNAVFKNIKVYNVQDRLDVIKSEPFLLEIIDPSEGLELFTNNDAVLSVDGLSIITATVGESKIRFMAANSILKDLVIHVMDKVAPMAVKLDSNFGTPEPKKK